MQLNRRTANTTDDADEGAGAGRAAPPCVHRNTVFDARMLRQEVVKWMYDHRDVQVRLWSMRFIRVSDAFSLEFVLYTCSTSAVQVLYKCFNQATLIVHFVIQTAETLCAPADRRTRGARYPGHRQELSRSREYRARQLVERKTTEISDQSLNGQPAHSDPQNERLA